MGTAEGGWNESVERVSKREGVRKHLFFFCKNEYVGNVRRKSMFYVGNLGWCVGK